MSSMPLPAAVWLLLQTSEPLRLQLRDAVSASDHDRACESIAALVEKNSESSCESLLMALPLSHKVCADLTRESDRLRLAHRRTLSEMRASGDEAERAEFRDRLNDLERRIDLLERSLGRGLAIQDRLVQGLAEISDARAISLLLSRFQTSAEWPLRAAAAVALSMNLNGDFNAVAEGLLNRLKQEKVASVVVPVIEGLRRRKDKRAAVVEALIEKLQSDYWQVVVTAAASLAEIEDPSAVQPLIQVLARVEGRPRADVHRALVRLTGVQRDDNPEAWKAWWRENGERFLKGSYAPPPLERAEPSRAGDFFGLRIVSRNVIFVLDRSDSMREETSWKPSEEDRQLFDRIPAPGRAKLEVARFQLKKALLTLPAGTRFNLVYHNENALLFSDAMSELDDRARDRAFKFIDGIRASGATDLHAALRAALSFCREPDGTMKKDAVDTIYILSDGLPNAGKNANPDRLVQWLSARNIVHRIEVHTIYTGKENDRGLELMKELSQRNGGRWVWPGGP
jgi:hypothetical protein